MAMLFLEIVSVFGGGAALVAVATFLAKILVEKKVAEDTAANKAALEKDLAAHKDLLSRSTALALESAKAELNRSTALELESAKHTLKRDLLYEQGAIDIYRDELQRLDEKEGEREKRIHAQIVLWASPILGAIDDLRGRLNNILETEGHRVVADAKASVSPQWSIDHEYFLSSTAYYFAQYFCWTQMLRDKLSFELFRSHDEMDRFLEAMEQVAKTLGSFPLPGFEKDTNSTDRQIFRLQQRAIGESLLVRNDGRERVMTYQEFMERWQDRDQPRFNRHFRPLSTFFHGLRKKEDIRWIRLQRASTELENFRSLCKQALGL